MNIIRAEREDVIVNNNIGTQQIRDVLENTNKLITSLDFLEPLHGDLDFSVVKELGFGMVREIRIPKGNVTSIVNLPDNINKFSCIQNLLVSLENLPETLEEINVNNNYIGELKLKNLKNLKIVHMASNRITGISRLPPSLVELHCENNSLLETMHLGGLNLLKVLHISNTGIHIIIDYPEGVADFERENTPGIEFRNAVELPIHRTNKQDKDDADIRRNKDYIEALNDYFELKNTYETNLSKARHKIFNKKKKGKLEAKMVKIPCVKCKRPVGTIFQTQDNKHIAICGDTANPCKLDIQIYTGVLDMYKNMMYDDKQEMEVYKQKMMRNKLDTLFGYVNEEESTIEFKDSLSEYNSESRMYQTLADKHDEIYNNTIKNESIEKKNEAIFKLNESVKTLFIEYKETSNIELLKEGVRTQYEQINAESRNLRMLKYDVMEMDKQVLKSVNAKSVVTLDQDCQLDVKIDTDGDVSQHILVQRPVTLTELEYSFHESPNVMKFVR